VHADACVKPHKVLTRVPPFSVNRCTKMPRTKTYRELTEVEYMTKYMYYGWKSNLEIKLAIHHPSSTKTCHNLRLAPRKV